MKRKGKKIGTAAVMLFILFGLLGCSGKKTASENEISGNPAVQITEDGEVNPETDSGAESEGAESGFATPEEAVLDYLAGMRDNDYSRMEASFWGNGSAKDISCQYGYLCGIDLIPEIAENSTVIFSEKEDAAKLLAQITQRMKEADFGSMEFMGFVLPDDLSDTYSTDSYQGNLSAIAQNYGASELANRVAAIAVNGNQYLLFFDLIQQEDRWYNFQLGGFFASVLGLDSNTAGCVRMDEEDEKILKELLEDTHGELPETRARAEAQKTEAEGFDTPWQAAADYLEGMAAKDQDRMLGTFSIESYAKNYDLQAYMEYAQMYSTVQQEVKFPPVNAFAQAVLGGERKEQLEQNMLKQGSALYMCSCYMSGSEVMEEGAFLTWEEFASQMDLGSIEVVGYISPEALSETYDPERMSSLLDEQAKIYGAEEIQECVVVFSYEEERYCLFTEAAKYNGRWYNSKLGNRLALQLGLYTEYMGTMPLEAIGDPADLEELITFI